MRIYGLLSAVVVSAVALGLGMPQGHAKVFNVDATWSSPTVGYATNIEPDDRSGSYLGEQIDFNSVALFPHPMSASIDTPNFGEITLNFTSIVSSFNNSAGEFYEMTGTDSAGGLDLMTAVIAPAHGIPRFEVEGYGFGDLPPPPPPQCTDCNPPPIGPIGTPGANVLPGGAAAVPEPSTWAMMGIGLLGLAFAGFRQRKNRLATI
jgi:PEP-CTERM motif